MGGRKISVAFKRDSIQSVKFEPSSNITDLELLNLLNSVKEKVIALEGKLPFKPRTDTSFILKFLRAKKYNVDATVLKIQQYYKHIHKNMGILNNLRPMDNKETFDTNAVTILKEKVNGSRVFYCRIRNWDTVVSSLRDLQRAGIFMIEEVLMEPDVQRNGFYVIVDVGGFGFSHARQCNPRDIKAALQMGLEGLPTRIPGIHVVNAPTIFWPVYKLLNKMLPSKISSRFFIHDNFESLHKHINPKILPKGLGGDLEDDEAIDSETFNRVLKLNLPYESYWSSEGQTNPIKKLSRKRSSVLICDRVFKMAV